MAQPPRGRCSGEGEGLDSIRIYCRFAPPPTEAAVLSHEIYGGGDGHNVVVRDDHNGSALEMSCERAFDGRASQEEVHREVAQPLLPKLLQGYNCTLLAFGQTASGKTHTMHGPQGGRYNYRSRDPLSGVVPRAVVSLFELMEAQRVRAEVDFSYFEIYNEVVSDLIAKATSSDASDRSYVFKGTDKVRFEREISRVRVKSADEFLHFLEVTNANRQLGGTDQNQVSSRSHSVVLLRVHTQASSATMCMVDLAGSECIKKSNAQGMRRYETKNINTSLFALKQVIHALYKRKEHVPYGDSMLTRTLADGLSGNAFLRILVCCTSRAEDVQETMTTLRFAKEASCVVRKAPGVMSRSDFPRERSGGEQLEALRQDRNALAGRMQELEEELVRSRADGEHVRNENAVLQMQVRQLQETNAQLISQLEGAESYASQLNSLQSQNKELRSEETKAAEQNVYLSNKVSEVQRHMQGILQQIKAVTAENDALRSELRQARSGSGGASSGGGGGCGFPREGSGAAEVPSAGGRPVPAHFGGAEPAAL